MQFEQSKHAAEIRACKRVGPERGRRGGAGHLALVPGDSLAAGSGDLRGKISKKRERFWEVPAPSNNLWSDTTCAGLSAPPLFALTVSEGLAALGRFSKVDRGGGDRNCDERALS